MARFLPPVSLGSAWARSKRRSRAGLVTNLAGNNNDLQFTAVAQGPAGNNVRVRIVVAGNNTALSVSVSGNDITINSATDGSAAATSTANQVITAFNNSANAKALATIGKAPGNDGTGVVAALAYTKLTGGKNAVYRASGSSW